MVFCAEVVQITTGVLSSEWLLSWTVVFPLVSADAALGRHGPIPGKAMIPEVLAPSDRLATYFEKESLFPHRIANLCFSTHNTLVRKNSFSTLPSIESNATKVSSN